MKHYYASLLAGVLTLGTATGVSAAVATVNGTEYATLSEAFTAADGTYPIVLGEDITVTSAIPVNTSVTLDLNGYTITNNVSANRLFRVGNATFTIEGNGGTVATSATSYGVVDLTSGSSTASLVVNGGTFTGGTDAGAYFKYRTSGQSMTLTNVTASVDAGVGSLTSIVNGQNVSVNLTVEGGQYTNGQPGSVFAFEVSGSQNPNPADDCSISLTDVEATAAGGPVIRFDGGDATLTDCTFTAQGNAIGNDSNNAAIAVANGGNITVDGGTYTAKYAAYVFNSGGQITVKSGTMNGIVRADESATPHKDAKLVLEGGTYNGAVTVASNADCSISGGEFKDATNLSQYCADGFALDTTVNSNGYYAAVEAVATVNGTPYKTLDEAFEAANQMQTSVIKLCDDVTVTSAIAINNDITLDLNGHTITNDVSANRLFRVGNATFTIDGNGGTVATSATSYGVVDLTSGSSTASLVVNGGTFTGGTDAGAYFKYRTSGQSMTLTNVTASVDAGVGSLTSIVNGQNVSVNLTVEGGQYTNGQPGSVFAFEVSESQNPNPADDCSISLTDVEATAAGGPVIRFDGGDATVTDCTFTAQGNAIGNDSNNAAIAVANGGNITVEGGTYTAKYAAYVFNSGGQITVKSGTMNGIVRADESATPHKDAKLVLEGGTYNGAVTVASNADCTISGGQYKNTTGLSDYCADGYKFGTPDANGYSSLVLTTSSVDEVMTDSEADSANSGVFNLNGVRVADNIHGVSPGIYVVNGKTILVK